MAYVTVVELVPAGYIRLEVTCNHALEMIS
jgi:hypothetical protein